MYQMSQGYSISNCSTSSCGSISNGSNLEYIASSSVEGIDVSTSSLNKVYESAISLSATKQDYGTNVLPNIIQNFVASSSHKFNYNNLTGNSSYSGLNNFNDMSGSYQLFPMRENYHFIPDDFLKPGKEGSFVGHAEEIQEHIEEAFERMFECKFPADIKVSILDEKKFRKIAPNPATVGLSVNRKRQGLISEVFVLNSTLARVMLTLGHELGHVLTTTLPNQHDEEAKAYAFSLAWMKILKENNIADLGDAIVTERPAENGLHNVAFAFVQKMLNAGKGAWDVYSKLIKGNISVNCAS